MRKHISACLFLSLLSQSILTDSFTYNSYNNHGVIGLINMPTARFYDEASHGITLYDGTPDQKITLTHLHIIGWKLHFFIQIYKIGDIVVLHMIQSVLRTTKIKVLILKSG